MSLNVGLFTWVDVEDVLLRARDEGHWPSWLVRATPYWDALRLGIKPGRLQEVEAWLADVLDPRYSRQDHAVALESLPGQDRGLTVLFEETEEEAPEGRFEPTLRRPAVVRPASQRSACPPDLPAGFPPVVAFHSFKGGVGRTLQALALAQRIAASAEGRRVLLVDADMEAPGISWLLHSRLPRPPVAFADLLVLAHGDPDPTCKSAVALVADRVGKALVGGVYVLPAFRSLRQFRTFEVRPEVLSQSADDPFIITALLGDVGKRLRASAVIVDLRAGLSEFATGLLLDPRVYRVFVTTLSSQSKVGTEQLLSMVNSLAPPTRDTHPLPAIVISQVMPELRSVQAQVEADLIRAAVPYPREVPTDVVVAVSDFDQSLVCLPDAWEEVMDRIQGTTVAGVAGTLMESLPLSLRRGGRQAAITDVDGKRRALGAKAEALQYAERGEGQDFLVTQPLSRLASDFSRQMPIAVVMGAKGAGKTYTFLQVIRRKTWQAFVEHIGPKDIEIGAVTYPVLQPYNLEDAATAAVQETMGAARAALGLDPSKEEFLIRDHLRDWLSKDLHESEWRERWLDAFAWSVGCQTGQEGAGRRLVGRLAEGPVKLLIVVDGLEHVFQDLAGNAKQQVALRALLQEVPEWLRQRPGQPLGLLVFVRQDMVVTAVPQNSGQLIDHYRPYALAWSRVEALRLVAWVAQQAGVLDAPRLERLSEMGEGNLKDVLVQLWGRKLGSEKSREGRSADWVLAALSDFRGQIQARDLVRFLEVAAKGSAGQETWPDRILIPTAIRNALFECSRQKISEIEQENRPLKELFGRLRQLPESKREIPFAARDVGLDSHDVAVLRDNGVIIEDEPEGYYMPEIFRQGLGFKLKDPARARVLALARRHTRQE